MMNVVNVVVCLERKVSIVSIVSVVRVVSAVVW